MTETSAPICTIRSVSCLEWGVQRKRAEKPGDRKRNHTIATVTAAAFYCIPNQRKSNEICREAHFTQGWRKYFSIVEHEFG